jgi:hypothetical protein
VHIGKIIVNFGCPISQLLSPGSATEAAMRNNKPPKNVCSQGQISSKNGTPALGCYVGDDSI